MIARFLLFVFLGASTFAATTIVLRSLLGRAVRRRIRKLFRKRPASVFLRPHRPTGT